MTSLERKRVYVAGHRGMVGSALVRRLQREACQIVVVDRAAVDLTRQAETEAFFEESRPHLVFLAAARVGGILANSSYPAEFLYDNLAIATNVIQAAHRSGVEKLLFLGSSCIYPKQAQQPISEDALLTGPLEPTNEWYAVAKIAGIKLVQAYRRQYGADFISLQPANLYGPNDNFDPETSHVIAALVRRIDEAKRLGRDRVTVWGTGKPRREFLYVDDLADACVVAMKEYSDESPLNVGTGKDVTVDELARLIAEMVGYRGAIEFDPSKPDGTPRKVLDVSRLARVGWQAKTSLKDGLRQYYKAYLATVGREAESATAA